MARESSSGLGVNTRYGPLNTPDGAMGELGRSNNGLRTLAVEWSSDIINSDSLAPVTVLSNCLVTRAWLEVETALSLSGTSAGLAVGAQGALAANCAEVTGTSVPVSFANATLLGTFSTGITATTTIVLGVTSGSINHGSGRFIIEYMKA